MNTDYLSTLSAWRDEMSAGLRKPYSWLALAGLFWLAEGENSLGSAAGCAVQLPARAPAALGSLWLAGSQVTLRPAPGAQLRISAAPVDGETRLYDDHAEQPSLLFWEDVRMVVLKRGARYAVRLWDPQRPERSQAPDRTWHPADPAARVQARIERHTPPRVVPSVDIVGTPRELKIAATLHFEYAGVACAPDAELLADGRYSLMLKDAPGSGNYGGGRFVESELPAGDTVVLDLNRLYNPPCAFTPYATCPVPTPNSVLPVAILAGERYPADG
ncbi:MAG: DUF1684 domain-containing protein [Anaerolineales bacterium]|nr:DUF1684 domain-containing protein [Anaerolineales bacterium]MBX3004232.1 DUF1684 domain-containing protein [Anaerolineales bacterium]MCW5839243.1 DUF1684 domain-containing protein [Anaerolineales bacterium]